MIIKDLKKHIASKCGQLEEEKSPVSQKKPSAKRSAATRDFNYYTSKVTITRPLRTHPNQPLTASSHYDLSDMQVPPPFIRSSFY